MSGGRILDYGCGTGTHLKYFSENGYEPYGCDIVKHAIDKCKAIMPDYSNNFYTMLNTPTLSDCFSGKFDLIISNQVLYYLNDNDINLLVSQFYNLLKEGGVFFATMISLEDNYSTQIVSQQDEMSKVVAKGRVNETTYINFKTEQEVVEIFKPFSKLHLGYYEDVIREDEGVDKHNLFVGIK